MRRKQSHVTTSICSTHSARFHSPTDTSKFSSWTDNLPVSKMSARLSLQVLRSCRSVGSVTGRNYSSVNKGSPERVVGEHSLGGGGSGNEGSLMKSWQLHSYGGPADLQLSQEKIPALHDPEEVLVRVKAASVNPIDLAMTNGYGAETINILRHLQGACEGSLAEVPQKLLTRRPVIEFPLTLGRDFAGVVEHTGPMSTLHPGDEVFGVVAVQRHGSHAEYLTVPSSTVRLKPRNLSFVEAASLPYVALTTWSALKITGAYWNLAQRKILVLGGSGGVGTFCLQYLKSQGSTVVTTCSADAVSFLQSLHADKVIDYRDPGSAAIIAVEGPYDCILHLSGPATWPQSQTLVKHLKPGGQFITLSPPFLQNVDRHGLVGGAVKNAVDLISQNVASLQQGKSITKWAFFVPLGQPLETVSNLAEREFIKPVVQAVYPFSEVPAAYRKLEEGHLRGKIVIDMSQK